MTPVVLGLVVIGAVAHAAWNLALKAAGAPSGVRFLWMSALPSALVVLPFAIWQWNAQAPGQALDWWVPFLTGAVSATIHTGYFLSLQRGYQVGDVGLVYPLARGTGPLLAVVGAVVLLGERPGWLVLLGAALVVLGVFIVGFAGGISGAAQARPGIIWGLIVGVGIAAYTLWDAYAVINVGVPAAVHMASIGIGQSIALAPFALRDRPALMLDMRRHWRPALAFIILSPLSYLAILFALQIAPDETAVSVIAPGREVSVLLVGLAGWLVFKEPYPKQRLLGGAVVLGGIVLLVLG